MSTRDHHVHGVGAEWGPRANAFRPLTQRDTPFTQPPGAASGVRSAPRRRGWFAQLRQWWRARGWLPQTRDDRDAAMFLAGQVWMGGVLGGVWLLVNFL